MRKLICLIMVCLVGVLLFTGCGNKEAEQSEPPAQSSSSQDSGSEIAQAPSADVSGENTSPEAPLSDSPGGIYKEAGQELGDFYAALDGGMKAFEGAVNSFETDDFELMDVGGDFITLTGSVVSITQYDYLQSGDNPREEGKNGKYDAIREKNGDVITFSQSMTREEDGFGPDSKKGDVVSESGTLNTSTNTLTMEKKTERGGSVISRTITEVVMLPDGTFIAQDIYKPVPPADERLEDRGIATFVRFTDGELEIIAAHFEPDVNFTYDSIAGKTDAAPETMAEGYTKVRQMVVKGDTVTATKY